jgi:hypothetical protein
MNDRRISLNEGAKGSLIYQVVVKHKALGCRFVCLPTPRGFKCGRCGHGNLGLDPKAGRRCRVCRAKVAEVLRVSNKDRFVPDRVLAGDWNCI